MGLGRWPSLLEQRFVVEPDSFLQPVEEREVRGGREGGRGIH